LKAELILAYLISFHFGLQVWLAFATAVFLFSGSFVEQKHRARRAGQGCSKVAAKPLGIRKFSGFLPKAAMTLRRRCAPVEGRFFHT